jgi:hypothetical protein
MKKAVSDLYDMMDSDFNGKIDFEEFQKQVRDLVEGRPTAPVNVVAIRLLGSERKTLTDCIIGSVHLHFILFIRYESLSFFFSFSSPLLMCLDQCLNISSSLIFSYAYSKLKDEIRKQIHSAVRELVPVVYQEVKTQILHDIDPFFRDNIEPEIRK